MSHNTQCIEKTRFLLWFTLHVWKIYATPEIYEFNRKL